LTLLSMASDDSSGLENNNPPHKATFPSSIQSIMAPMVAASDYPFRCLARQHGVDMTFTQMLHSKNLVKDKQFLKTHLDLWEYKNAPTKKLLPQQKGCLEGLVTQPVLSNPEAYTRGPLIAQLAGSEVASVLQAAELLMKESGGQLTGIDLNLGCPQGIARKGNYGAFLMEQDFDGVFKILTALSQWAEMHYPQTMISAKIRLPVTDEILVKERIPRLVETGISFLTIHGRTLYENKTKVRGCHIDRIKLAIETAHNLKPGFPVIANGGVETSQDAIRIRQETGASAVMSSEALLETPNVFSPDFESTRQTARQRLAQQLKFSHDYLDWCSLYPPLPGVLGGQGSFNIARGHIFKFLHRYLQEQPDLRERLGDNRLNTLQQARSLVNELESRYETVSDDELESYDSSKPSASWYRRHRQSLKLVHQRQVGGARSVSLDTPTMSVEEKKALLRERISKLKEQRLMKN
jgi:tRNA-dihydrouridine synthase 1